MAVSEKSPSVWAYKPWWCQPWSILLVGCVLIGGCWGLTRTVWITAIVAIPVVTWMAFFLLIFPKLVRESGMIDDLAREGKP